MPTYSQQLNQYNRYCQNRQTVKKADWLSPKTRDMLDLTCTSIPYTDKPWSIERTVNYLYGLLDPPTQKVARDFAKTNNGILSPIYLVTLGCSSPNENKRFWTELSKATMAEYHGKNTGFFSNKEMRSLRDTIVDVTAKGLSWYAGPATKLPFIPDGVYRLHGREAVRTTGGAKLWDDDRVQLLMHNMDMKPPHTPTVGEYAIPSVLLGGGIALGGKLLKRPKLGLGLGLLTAVAGTGYGIARTKGYEGFKPINSAAEKFSGMFGSKNS